MTIANAELESWAVDYARNCAHAVAYGPGQWSRWMHEADLEELEIVRRTAKADEDSDAA